MLEWLADLFTLDGMFNFLLGVATACTYHIVKARIKREILILRWQFIAIPFALGIVLYMAIQTQQNATCVREFQEVLKYRSEISADNDRISQEQRRLLYDWIHNLVFPPPQIARLGGGDPDRQAWALDLTLETDKAFKVSLDRQNELDKQRAAHPLPPPTCGE